MIINWKIISIDVTNDCMMIEYSTNNNNIKNSVIVGVPIPTIGTPTNDFFLNFVPINYLK